MRLVYKGALLCALLSVPGFAHCQMRYDGMSKKDYLANQWLQSGDQAEQDGNHLQAIADYKKALDYNPSKELMAQAYEHLGGIYENLERLEEAVGAYRNLVVCVDRRKNPDLFYGANGKVGIVLESLHENEEAIKALEIVTQYRPHDDLGKRMVDDAHKEIENLRHVISRTPAPLDASGHPTGVEDQDSTFTAAATGNVPEMFAIALEIDADASRGQGEQVYVTAQQQAWSKMVDAVKEWESAVAEAYPNDPDRKAFSTLYAGFALYRLGRFAEAAQEYAEAARLSSKYRPAYFNLALSYYRLGRLNDAAEALGKLNRIDPAYVKQPFCRQLLALLPPVAEIADAEVGPDIDLGVRFYDAKDYQHAEAEFRQAIRQQPRSGKAHLYLGETLDRLGHPLSEVEAEYREAVRYGPNLDDAHRLLGTVFYHEKKYQEAEPELKTAISLTPNVGDLHDKLGDALLSQLKYAEAEAEYRKAVALDPAQETWHFDLAEALISQNKPGEAEPECRRALDLNSGNPWNHSCLAYALGAQGKYADAETEYRKAIAIDGKISDWHYALGVTLLKQRKPAADAELTEAITLDPQNADALYQRGWTGLALGHGQRSAEDARAFVGSKGWRDSRSLYAVLVGYLGARQAGRETDGRKLLDDCSTGCDQSRWPYPVVRYCRREIDAQQLFALATDNDKMTEAQAYIGVELLLTGKQDEAAPHLRWVIDHGNKNFNEYHLVVALSQ